jgi:hypothetical protein
MDLREVPNEPFRRHPWEVARARFFLRVLADGGAFKGPGRLLDVGAGDGWFSEQVLERSAAGTEITLWDSGYGDLLGGDTGDPRVARTAEQPDERFDTILLMDVIEHVENDSYFLRAVLAKNARPGALVLVSVPAWQALYSDHDRAIHHYRRYSPRKLRKVLEGTGLRIERRGGLFHSLLVPRTVSVARERLRRDSDGDVPEAEALRWDGGDLGYRLIDTALRVDNSLSRWAARLGVQVPGLTVWALCRA